MTVREPDQVTNPILQSFFFQWSLNEPVVRYGPVLPKTGNKCRFSEKPVIKHGLLDAANSLSAGVDTQKGPSELQIWAISCFGGDVFEWSLSSHL